MQEEIIQWFNTYSDDMFKWAYHKTSSKELAEDLVQESFLSAVRGYENFKKESQPKTWLFSILNHKIIDFYRKKGRSLSEIREPYNNSSASQTDYFFDSEGRWTLDKDTVLWEEDIHILDDPHFNKVLKSCMNELPENWNFALTAKFLLEKETASICQELGVTPSNYWQIMHRAKLMLKKCIDMNWKI